MFIGAAILPLACIGIANDPVTLVVNQPRECACYRVYTLLHLTLTDGGFFKCDYGICNVMVINGANRRDIGRCAVADGHVSFLIIYGAFSKSRLIPKSPRHS